jgi:hypothetical protein
MRFSIVFDDNGTTLAASEGDEKADGPERPGENIRYFDIPDDLSDGELRQTVERVLTDMDPSARPIHGLEREAEDGPH